ncbi:MAG TPA: MmcQ/YjbR family DNA-binding protein [Nocardioides sp.]|uniref:MmcQ/YjbR family DNA-binding protein n=1 Tax=Nocardioides sp. TaxID=35761 RepID=UPI002D80B19B|nr:MmcQ/YjbR family DNA-binding protein [Nocardioides sp.]HET6652904.1 MmcQ/YjbR family DNA-binding protein [Nocardioides sp.]
MPVTVEDVRRLALTLPRTTEHLIRDRVKFRVKQIVYVSFSRDETLMGFAFPREQRAALVESEPDKFQLPSAGDMRYQWVVARMEALDLDEMTELVTDAWTMVVPKYVAREYFDGLP